MLERKRSDYGAMFAEMLEENIRNFDTSGWRRDRNPGAPFSFGENHLRKYVQTALQTGAYLIPQVWPRLLVERQVCGDFQEIGTRRHGCVDYLFASEAESPFLHLTDVLATCEVGGPTRPKLLEGSKLNWYPKIVDDIEKQLWRAQHYSNAEHYLAMLVQPRPQYDVHRDLAVVLDAMCKEVRAAEVVQTAWRAMPDIKNLNVVVYRVIPRSQS